MHYMAVTGYRKAYIAVLIACRDFKVFEVAYDEEEARVLMEMEQKFWQHVQDGTPPPVSGQDCDTETLLALHPDSQPGEIDLWGREALLEQWQLLGRQIGELEQQKEGIKQQIMLDMGDFESGRCGQWKVSWKNQQRKTFDHKRFAKDHPGVNMAPYYKESSSRVFKITG